MRKRLREAEETAKRHRVWLAVSLVLLVAAGMLLAVTVTNHKAQAAALGTKATTTCTSSDGKFCWGGQGEDAESCRGATAGTPMLWIFNPGGNSTALPKDLVITWSTGQQITYIGWSERGQGAWQLTVPLVGTFPPQSAYVDYSGTLGNHAVLTISGCNESTITGTTTNTTTTSTTATTATTGTTTTGTTGTTTSTTPTTTVTTTTPATTTAPGTTTHPATTPATPPCVPTLTVNKIADSATVTVGGTASFTVTVGNTSASCTATNVVLYEQPGTGLIVAGVTLNGASCSQGPVSCEVGTLKAGASVAVKVTSTALNTAGTYTNCIRLQSNNTGPQTSCATVTVAAAVTTTPTTTPAPTTTTTSTPVPKPKPPAHHAKPPVHHKQHGTTTPVPQADTK